jgi:glycerol kinase
VAELLLGLDLGTTRVCALAAAPDGRVLARAHRPLEAASPAPGHVEQDPEAMVARSIEALREALAGARASARDVAAVGLASQRATAVAWDARSGRALAPAIGWQDQRTAPRVAELRRAGVALTTLPSSTKFEHWLRGADDDARAVRAAAEAGALRLGTPDAWLGFRLGADRRSVTDPGCASCTGLYGLARGDWDERALALFGVPREALPEVVATCEPAGALDAAHLGAPVPLAARAGDQQAAAFAAGARGRGDAKLTLGTSAMLDVHAGEAPAAPGPARGARGRDGLPSVPGAHTLALWRLAPGARDALCLEGSVVTAGAALDWLARLGLAPAAEDLAAAAAPDAGGAWFVPALQGLGTPFLDLGARGTLGGLSLATGRGEVARAALEGVAQRCADLCEALGVGSRALPVDGGLARSDLLLQLVADLTGLALERAAEVETTALGAALLAGVAVGIAAPDRGPGAAAGPGAARFAPRVSDAARGAARARWRDLLLKLPRV